MLPILLLSGVQTFTTISLYNPVYGQANLSDIQANWIDIKANWSEDFLLRLAWITLFTVSTQ